MLSGVKLVLSLDSFVHPLLICRNYPPYHSCTSAQPATSELLSGAIDLLFSLRKLIINREELNLKTWENQFCRDHDVMPLNHGPSIMCYVALTLIFAKLEGKRGGWGWGGWEITVWRHCFEGKNTLNWAILSEAFQREGGRARG